MDKIRLFLVTAALVVIGAVLSVMQIKNINILKQDPIDLYDSDLDWSKIEPGQHVRTDLYFIMDYFMYNGKDVSSSADKSRIYTIPALTLQDGMLQVSKFMGVYTAEDYAMFDALTDSSLQWWVDSTGESELNEHILIEGITREMSAEEKNFLKTTLVQDLEYSSAEAESMIIPIVITRRTLSGERIPLIIGIVMALIGVAIFVVWIILAQKKKNSDASSEAPVYTSVYTNNSTVYGANNATGMNNGMGAPYSANGTAAPARPMTGPGSYDSEGSPDFGTFGMTNNIRPANGTTQVASVYGQQNNTPMPQNQNYGQAQDAAPMPQNQNYGQMNQMPGQTQPQQPQSNFGSFGRSTSEFVDFESFKNSLNSETVQKVEEVPQISVPLILEADDKTDPMQ